MNLFQFRKGIAIIGLAALVAVGGCQIRKNVTVKPAVKQEQVVAPVSLQSLDARVTALEARNARINAQAAQRAKAARAAQ